MDETWQRNACSPACPTSSCATRPRSRFGLTMLCAGAIVPAASARIRARRIPSILDREWRRDVGFARQFTSRRRLSRQTCQRALSTSGLISRTCTRIGCRWLCSERRRSELTGTGTHNFLQRVHLAVDLGVDLLVAVAHADGDDAAQEIQVLLAVGVPDVLILGARY